MTPQQIEEFNQKFPHKIAEVIDDFDSPVKSNLQDFITSLLEKQREEYVEMIEKLKLKEDAWKHTFPQQYSEGYRMAIDDIINLIKSHDK